MSAVIWNAETRVVLVRAPSIYGWLGQYSGMDKSDPLTNEIVARKGATDSKSLQAYGTIAGTIGGTALCGGNIGCGILGGIIGGYIASKIPVAAGSTMEDLVSDTWNNYTAPRAKLAAKAILTVHTYLTLRDLAITNGHSDADLWAMGLPAAPIIPAWKPSEARYNAALAFQSYELSDSRNKECDAAKNLGIVNSKITCRDYIWATYYNGEFGPIAKPGAPIDWFAVGRDEVAAYHGKKNGECSGDYAIFDPASGNLILETGGSPYGANLPCPSTPPSEAIAPLLDKLRGAIDFSKVHQPSGSSGGGGGGGGSGILPLAIGAGIVGLIIWALL